MEFRFILINNRTGEKLQIPEPVNFDSLKVKLTRNKEWHGIISEFSEQDIWLEGHGYEMVVSENENYGVNMSIQLLIEFRCNSEWQVFYTGMLIPETLTIENGTECFAKIHVGQIDVQTDFTGQLDVKVDIENPLTLDGKELNHYPNLGKEIDIPAKTIKVISRAAIDKETRAGSGQRMGITYYKNPFGEAFSELEKFESDRNFSEATNPNTSPQNVAIFTNVPENLVQDNLFTLSIKLKIAGVGGGEINDWAGLPYPIYIYINSYIQIRRENGTIVRELFGKDINTTMPGQNYEFNFDEIIEIEKGHMLVFYSLISIPANVTWHGADIIIYPESSIRISAKSIFPATKAKIFMLHETLSRVAESISNNRLTVKSGYYGRTDSEINPTVQFDGTGGLRCLTNGFLLRRAIFEDGTIPKFTAAFSELFKNLTAIDAVGLGIEHDTGGSYVRIEPFEYFYNDDIVLKFKNIDVITREYNADVIYGTANFGYKKWLAENTFNSIDVIHGKRQYRTNIIFNKSFDKISDFIADGYCVEATRRRQLTDHSKSWGYDNDIFIFDLFRQNNNLYVTRGKGNPDTLIDPDTVINIEISPLRNAARWFSWMMQCVPKEVNKHLIYCGTEGYSGAVTTSYYAANPIISNEAAENQSITSDSIAIELKKHPIFKPEIVKFRYPLNMREFYLLKENPYGQIEFDGEAGWIRNMEYDITSGLADFEIIPKAI